MKRHPSLIGTAGLLGGVVVMLLGVGLGQSGLLRFPRPHLLTVNQVSSEVAVPTEARIVAIDPISLDCRARVHAQVPVVATRHHEAFGVVYRTDRVTLDAVGDVDTCVDGNGTTVQQGDDGTTEVVIDAAAISFVRPRVDANAAGTRLSEDEGQVGKLTDALPWVDDNLGLTPLAYAYAQNVIGSGQCMETAYAVTQGLLLDAYRQQVIDQGADPDLLSVRIAGEPSFAPTESFDPGDVELTVGDGQLSCTASDRAAGPAGAGSKA
jgi:hypothetical protein